MINNGHETDQSFDDGGRGDQPEASRRGVTAVVKWFNALKGFGFVQMDDGSPDAFLHVSVLSAIGRQELPDGTTILCDIMEGPRGLQVASITRIESIPDVQASSHEMGPPGDTVEGTVKFYNQAKGFGFVIPDDGGKDVFISARTLQQAGLMTLEANQRVRLTTRMGHKGPMAQRLEVI
jgi:CspA family cold shock protein